MSSTEAARQTVRTNERLDAPAVIEPDAALPVEADPLREPNDRFFARFGTFLATLPEEKAEARSAYAGFYQDLAKALRDDSHVVSVRAGEFELSFSHEWLGFPTGAVASTKQILSGSDHFHAFNFSESITFEVSVPTKNQPVIMGVEDVPTDRYWACWDGTTLLTIWRQAPDDRYPARSAGQVLESILRRSTAKAGLGLLVQACSPGCTNMYAHRVMRIDQFLPTEGESPSFDFDGDHPQLIRARLVSSDDEFTVVRGVHERIGSAWFHFARYKNASRRLIDTELLARRLTDDLLTLDYSTLYGPQGGFWRRVGGQLAVAWRALTFRGRTRQARRIANSLWIAMARIETMQRDWRDRQRSFNYYADRYHLLPFFDIDRKDDDDVVNAVTTDFVRAAVEHRATRRDNRVIVWATVFGGFAGAAAAIVASVLTATAGR